jgi:hypothetical protein
MSRCKTNNFFGPEPNVERLDTHMMTVSRIDVTKLAFVRCTFQPGLQLKVLFGRLLSPNDGFTRSG